MGGGECLSPVHHLSELGGVVLPDHHDDVGLAVAKVGQLLEVVPSGILVEEQVLAYLVPPGDLDPPLGL